MEQPRKAVVVTGFGPFGEHTVNASWIAVQELEKLGLGDSVDLHVYEIPVEYQTVQRLIPALWEKHSPQEEPCLLEVTLCPVPKGETSPCSLGVASPRPQGDPLSALSESPVSGTPGQPRFCRTLLAAGPWDTPNLTSQKANKTVKICNLLCVFMSSWRPLGSPSAWGYWLAEGAPKRQCFCLACDLVRGL
uniref:Pyroglutamyl-peptidase I n=1 Tax=Bos mutus grunniens TaxID=30521 RepID=A0A8B9YT00_BOSMU